jgi:hypothetical protein
MTIDNLIYKSGSAIVATTGIGSGQDMDSAIVAIHETKNSANSVSVTIGNRNNRKVPLWPSVTTGRGTNRAITAIGLIQSYKEEDWMSCGASAGTTRDLPQSAGVNEPQECHGRHGD